MPAEPRTALWWSRIGLAAALVLGAGLRLWSLCCGQLVWHPDEIFMLVFPLSFFSGDLNPHHFSYPTLHFYSLGLVYGAGFLCQWLFGAGWSSLQFAAYHYLWEPDRLLTWARLVNVGFALATVWWVGRLAEQLYGRFAGALAALLMAVCVIHVRQSILAAVDVPMTCWFAGAVWAGVRLLEREKWSDYALAGALVGLAGGTKYPGALAGVAVAAGHLLAGRTLLDRRLWGAGLVALGVFGLTSPYALLDFETFRRNFTYQAEHLQQGRGNLGRAWWYHLQVSLRYSLGWTGLGMGASAIGLALYKPRREVWVVLAGFLAYLLVMGSGKLTFVRYALPLMALQAALVAGAVQAVSRFRWRISLALLVALEPLWGSLRLAQIAGHEDTRTQARQWVETQVSPGAVLTNFGGWGGDVQLQTVENLWWRLKHFEGAFGRERLDQALVFLDQHLPPRPFYSYTVLASNQHLSGGSMVLVADRESPYVLLHRHPLPYSAIDSAFADSLALQGERVARFAPQGLASSTPDYDPIDVYYLPIGGFGDLQEPGPEIEIWRMKRYPSPPAGKWRLSAALAGSYACGAAEALGEKDPHQALTLAERAVALDPGNPEVMATLAQVLLHRKEQRQALVVYEQLLSQVPGGAEEHNNVGICYWATGQREKAVRHWQWALELGPGKADIHYNLGLAAYLAGDREQALQRWQRAASLQPASAKAHFSLALDYRDQGRDSLAAYHLEQALAIEPGLAATAQEVNWGYSDGRGK